MIDQIDDRLREQIYERAWGRCECIDAACGTHVGRCGEALRGAWVAMRVNPKDAPSRANLRALCRGCGEYFRDRAAG